ncbi:RING/U-box superfamily protein [Hibiscus syriacus]|uniref:RING-type E3 ubiquitin transferase n=1 Tax=Hibiscus syriacus TaxID=106335 RepID=A0A6A3B6E7_HIBSY|nr:RING/U-box superfamily protein [Hibiscus syriacus]
MSVSIDPSEQNSNPISHLLSSISSYDGNVLLAAISSLLLVILFVLLLHVYAKWFLAQARHRSRSSSPSHIFHPDRLRHFHAFTATFPTTPSKGLDSSVISSIPLFVFNMEEHNKLGLECVICLSLFEDNEVGRNLPKCGHGFHVECIDMWLNSHSNCPLCRAHVMGPDHTDSQATSASSSSLTHSLKRMLSRNRSERKFFPHQSHPVRFKFEKL